MTTTSDRRQHLAEGCIKALDKMEIAAGPFALDALLAEVGLLRGWWPVTRAADISYRRDMAVGLEIVAALGDFLRASA